MKISGTLAVVVSPLAALVVARRGRCAARRRQELRRAAPERRAARVGAAGGNAAGGSLAAGHAGAARRDAARQAGRRRRRRRRRARRAGSARSPASPPAWGSPRCCRISACRRAWAASCCSRCWRSASCSRCACCSRDAGSRQAAPRLRRARAPRATRRPPSRSRRRRNGAARRGSSRCWGPRPLRPPAARRCPPGFDAAGFVRHAKQQFVRLQAAHDAGDRAALRDVLTPEMYRRGDARPRQRRRAPGHRSRDPRRRGARSRDRRRSALGERPVHRHAARRCRRRAGGLRRSLEPVEARRRQDGLAARRHPATTPSGSAPRGLDALRPRGRSRRRSPTACSGARRGRGPASPRTPDASSPSRSGPLATPMRIDASGTIAAGTAPDGPPDLKLTLSPLAVPSFLADPTRWDEFVAVDGDAALAATLKGLAETLPWFVERAFAEALGPIVGQRVADAGRRLLALPGLRRRARRRERRELRARRSAVRRDGRGGAFDRRRDRGDREPGRCARGARRRAGRAHRRRLSGAPSGAPAPKAPPTPRSPARRRSGRRFRRARTDAR